MNKYVKGRFFATAMAINMATSIHIAHAGPMEDYYHSVGASSNVTPAQAYQAAGMNIFSAGGISYRVPIKSMQPIYFTPPSLKAGCGGIDFYKGSLGIVDAEEFVEFLRDVGQNAKGLAFHVALQTMAPELNSQLKSISAQIQEWTKYFRNSCETATLLMDKGANAYIKETVEKAKKQLLGSPNSRDASTVSKSVETNGQEAISKAPRATNEAGSLVSGPEINVLWATFSSIKTALTQDDKEMMMSLIGTVVSKKEGSGSDAVLVPKPWPKTLDVKSLIGDPLAGVTQVKMLNCGGDTKDCLSVTEVTLDLKSYSRVVYEQMDLIRESIIQRKSVDKNALKVLMAQTSIPVYKIIEMSASFKDPVVGNQMLAMYSKLIACDAVSNYFHEMYKDLDKVLVAGKVTQSSNVTKENIETLLEQTRRQSAALGELQKAANMELVTTQNTLNNIFVMERALYSNLSANIAANMSFGK